MQWDEKRDITQLFIIILGLSALFPAGLLLDKRVLSRVEQGLCSGPGAEPPGAVLGNPSPDKTLRNETQRGEVFTFHFSCTVLSLYGYR